MNRREGRKTRRCGTCYYRFARPGDIDINCSKHKKVKRPWESCGEWTSTQEVHERIRRNKGKADLQCRAY